MNKKIRHGAFGCLLVLSLYALKTLSEKRVTNPSVGGLTLSPEESRAQTQAMTRYHFGFRHVLADLIWVRLLQLNDHTPVERNKVSWEFGQLEAIIQLDPHFNRAYSFGAVFLTILRQDQLGAQYILERWAARFPNNYRPLLMLGFLHYHDLNDFEKGAHYILQAAGMPYAPDYLSSLGVRLASQAGASAQNLALSIELFESLPLEEGRKRLLLRIRDLNFALQKNAWLEAARTFRAQNKRSPASLNEIRLLMITKLAETAPVLPKEVSPEVALVLNKKYDFEYNPSTGEITSPSERVEGLGQVKIYSKEASQ